MAATFVQTSMKVVYDAYMAPVDGTPPKLEAKAAEAKAAGGKANVSNKAGKDVPGKKNKDAKKAAQERTRQENDPPSLADDWQEMKEMWDESVEMRRSCGSGVLLITVILVLTRFLPHCWYLAPHLSEPQIMLRSKAEPGKDPVIFDDFREAYWWLRDQTPLDSRVMAWWDYGYQINGVGNRTTIADGNTWNHEHIALLGKCLTTNEETSHAIIRHLADYVLIWTTRYAGMYSDDIAKSPHLARIGTSVYGDRLGCHNDKFYMERDGTPSDCMRESLLWRMHHQRFDDSIEPFKLYEEAYTTSHKMVRIYKVLDVSQESKQWRASKGVECAKEECYPPALAPTLALKRSYK